MTVPRGDRPRVVMIVRNDVAHDARVLREAASLHDAGWTVTVVGLQPPKSTLAIVETRSGVTIQRVAAPTAWRARWRDVRYYPWRAFGVYRSELNRALRRGPRGWRRAASLLLGGLAWAPVTAGRALEYAASRRRLPRPSAEDDAVDWWVRWQWSVLGWARAAALAAPDADVYHGHDLTGLPAAIAARERTGGRVVYDSHEIFTEAAGLARRPAWLRFLLARLERRLARGADLIVTVNPAIANELERRLGRRVDVIVHNAPSLPPAEGEAAGSPGQPAGPRTGRDLLRDATGVPATTRIALYHGAFLVERGIEQLAQASLEPGLEAVHFAFLGYGNALPILEKLIADPRFGGRLHLVAPVSPDELVAWIATADVGVMPIQPTTLNHRLSSPNKLFECLAAGVPVVVSDFAVMRAIVLNDPSGPLGAVCDPTDPASVAAAIRAVLDRSPEERLLLRRRCLEAARLRWNWERESERLIAAYRQLASTAAGESIARD